MPQVHFAVIPFSVDFSDGNRTDHKCCFCAEWCSTRSNCADRYNGCQGNIRDETDNIYMVYWCDHCDNIWKPIDYGDEIKFIDGTTLIIDAGWRIND